MSQLTSTRSALCGLIVGRNCAPPPPGPITLHPSNRCPLSPKEIANRHKLIPAMACLIRLIVQRTAALCT